MRTLLATAVLAALALLGPGQLRSSQAAGTEQYNVDPVHSSVNWSLRYLGATDVMGRMDSFSGTVMLDKDNPENSSVSFTVDMSSVNTGNPHRDDDVKSDKFFNVAQFAQASFTSTKVVMTGPDSADITGDLSWMGVTKSVTAHTTMIGEGQNMRKVPVIGFTADFDFKRSDFGETAMIPNLADEVHLSIHTLCNNAAAQAAAEAAAKAAKDAKDATK